MHRNLLVRTARRIARPVLSLAIAMPAAVGMAAAQYINFESSHVHPIALTPSGGRLVAVNTPDAVLEVFAVRQDGTLAPERAIPVGLEPVTVTARTDREVWVVNSLSDTLSIVDLDLGATVRTLFVGDEPADVAFANGRAFVAVPGEDAVKAYSLADLSQAPVRIDIFSRKVRALAVSPDGSRVYAVPLHSGNQTTVVNANLIHDVDGDGLVNETGLNLARLANLGLNTTACNTEPAAGGAPVPPYPALPDGLRRNPALTDPPPRPDGSDGVPPVGLIVKWDNAAGRYKDERGQDWTHCLPFRLPDRDLFVIDTVTLAMTSVSHLGTTLFDVSVQPGTGKVFVISTEARNQVRFEHPLGVRGHVVDNRVAIVDPAAGNNVVIVDLNGHIDRASDPRTNLAERRASISQPGMIAWERDGSHAWLTAIGSRKLFRVDGGCAAADCVFGRTRLLPDAVEVGEGPTGVALNEAAGRAYVLNRFANSIAVVDTTALAKIGELPLHDPSSSTVRDGRHFLYDGFDSSGHGDAACSSCHIFGDKDLLAWDLGDPTGSFAAYGTPGDNVRFIVPQNNQPTTVPPQPPFAAHVGFDPQKGPMTTQTLRGMLEPLHWRGDRGTMNAFNKAFVGLMGTADIGPVNGEPAGLTADQMELFRQFALGIRFPPNPFRRVDDTVPNAVVTVPGTRTTGNPATGDLLFRTGATDANQSCSACHALPFGAAGGKPGGLQPGDPESAKAALFNGNADGSPHSDLKVPHLRNMYEKTGPRFASHTNAADPPTDQRAGFGFVHDGSVPDMETFLSAAVFTVTPQQVRDLSAFMFFFPTGTRPAVGRHLTLPAGAPPTGSVAEEGLLNDLIRLGNAADAARHCDLVATAISGGLLRGWFLNGGVGSGGLWTTDVEGEPQVATVDLRRVAGGPISFLCATVGSGPRLGVDRDVDLHLNGTDCADGDAATFGVATEVAGMVASGAAPLGLSWGDQSPATGPGVRYDVAGGLISDLRAAGLAAATACLVPDLAPPTWDDRRPGPAPGDGWFYLVRAENSCGTGGFGPGRETIEPLVCGSAP